MSDVWIRQEDLERLNTSLKKILVEFNDAEKNTDHLQDMIGHPDGRTGLKDKTHDFEGGWDDRRDALIQKLTTIQSRVEEVGKGWKDFDLNTAKDFDLDQNAASQLPAK